jgi:hypothetical protein
MGIADCPLPIADFRLPSGCVGGQGGSDEFGVPRLASGGDGARGDAADDGHLIKAQHIRDGVADGHIGQTLAGNDTTGHVVVAMRVVAERIRAGDGLAIGEVGRGTARQQRTAGRV